MTTIIAQGGFRIRTDHTAAEGGTPVWAAAQNVNAKVPADTTFRIRFALSNTGSTNYKPTGLTIYYSVNGAAYAPVGSLSGITNADATNGLSPNNQSLSTSFLTGTGIFLNNGLYVNGGTGSDIGLNLSPNRYIEMEYGLKLVSPACNGNAYAFRIYGDGVALNSYTNTPFIIMPISGALAVTEADDAITAAGNVPFAARADFLEVSDVLTAAANVYWPTGILDITEADDTMVGAAITTPILCVLNANEANDGMFGFAYAVPAGGATAGLAATESNDVLVGVGTGSGDVGSARILEADDILVGSARVLVVGALNAVEDADFIVGGVSMLQINQWIIEGECDNSSWIQIVNPPDTLFNPNPTPPSPA